MKKLALATLMLVFVLTTGYAQSVIGQWQTIDDETGKPKSVVEIFEKNGKLFGKILKLLARKDEPICDLCTDDRKDKPVVGLEIIRNMEKSGDEYEDGTILDPKNGKIYDCKFWLDEDNSDILKVRGYIAFFYRTQTWHRVK